MPKKVVVDASVIVSAIFGGKPRKAFLKALRNCNLYISPEIKKELFYLIDACEDRIDKSKLKRLRHIITILLSTADEIIPLKRIDLSRDKTDNAYLALCYRIRADYLITRDKDLLNIPVERLKSAGLNRLKIVSPEMFLSEPL